MRIFLTVLLAVASDAETAWPSPDETPADSNADAGENPFKQDGDSSPECYAWAADGQCTLNRAFMLESCRYSCFEWYNYRRIHYPEAPIDKYFYCDSWAKRDECASNRAFMEMGCPESCKDRWEREVEPTEAASEPTPDESKSKKRRKKKRKYNENTLKEEV